MTPLRALIEYVARALVDDPAAVGVEESRSAAAVVYRVRVAPSDVGKLIGKYGRTAQALRLLLGAAAARSGQRAVLEIEEVGPGDRDSSGAAREAGRVAR